MLTAPVRLLETAREYVDAFAGRACQLSRHGTIHVRQEAGRARPVSLRSRSDGPAVLYFKPHSTWRNRDRPDGGSLFLQNLMSRVAKLPNQSF